MQNVTDVYRATICGLVFGPRNPNRPLKVRKVFGKVRYEYFIATKPGVRNTISVHRFVWEYFNGPVDEGLVIDHIDGDRSNNRLSNLRVVTQRENIMFGKGSILTEADVRTIRKRLIAGDLQKNIASSYNVTHQMISNINTGYSHSGVK